MTLKIKLVTIDEANRLYFTSKPPAYWFGLDQSDNYRHLQWEDPKPRWKEIIVTSDGKPEPQ